MCPDISTNVNYREARASSDVAPVRESIPSQDDRWQHCSPVPAHMCKDGRPRGRSVGAFAHVRISLSRQRCARLNETVLRESVLACEGDPRKTNPRNLPAKKTVSRRADATNDPIFFFDSGARPRV